MYLSIFDFLKELIISGEKKLGKIITPDKWKSGARNCTGLDNRLSLVSVTSILCIHCRM